MANFVFHAWAARRDLGTARGAVGAMLPDLWRMVDRAARPARDAVTSDAAGIGEVLAGMEHHAALDGAFHHADVFVRGETVTRAALATTGIARIGLFAHVAWEMLLDGALVRREGRALLDSLRDDVNDATRDDAIHDAARLHAKARGRDVADDFEAKVTRVLRAIADGDFVAGYARASEIARRLDAIRARVGLARMGDDEAKRAALTKALASIEADADRALADAMRLGV